MNQSAEILTLKGQYCSTKGDLAGISVLCEKNLDLPFKKEKRSSLTCDNNYLIPPFLFLSGIVD